MRALVEQVRRFAAIDSNVLISGETGTGKNAVARELHARGPRARRPFIVVDCAALTSSLIDSELFGHERGAFTDAVAARPGRFELAANGTVYLDAVTELSIEAQGKLLRIVEEKRVERLGGQTSLAVPARVVASADSRVEDAVREGRFRGDLFHRIGVLPIRIPPLRERPEDVAPLSRHFLGRAAAAAGREPPGLSPDVVAALRDYAWPGNVRELKHVVERALAAADGGTVTLRHLAERDSRRPRAQAGRRRRPAADARRGRTALHRGDAAACARQPDPGGRTARDQPEGVVGEAQALRAGLTAALDAVLSVVFAPACAACDGLLVSPTRGPVCGHCWESILPLTPPLCDACGDPLGTWRVGRDVGDDGGPKGPPYGPPYGPSYVRCTRCRRQNRRIVMTRAIGSYDGALRAIVHAFKYDGRRSLAARLGALMQARGADVLRGADAAVPVPLHPSRRRERGFDQASDLARHVGLPVVHALRRVRATAVQASLAAARRHGNVRGAFAARSAAAALDGRIVVLVDDVSTTGATLEACARALAEAGVREVRALTAARVVSAPR